MEAAPKGAAAESGVRRSGEAPDASWFLYSDGGPMTEQVVFTPDAVALVATLKAEHGPLIFHLSGDAARAARLCVSGRATFAWARATCPWARSTAAYSTIGGALPAGGIESWLAYFIALAFLLFRPQGLFGEKIIERI